MLCIVFCVGEEFSYKLINMLFNIPVKSNLVYELKKQERKGGLLQEYTGEFVLLVYCTELILCGTDAVTDKYCQGWSHMGCFKLKIVIFLIVTGEYRN